MICTGGLGPTADDLTTETVARSPAAAAHATRSRPTASAQMFARHGAHHAGEQPQAGDCSPRARRSSRTRSARRPATGSRSTGGGTRRFIVVMPGVPREMKPMLENRCCHGCASCAAAATSTAATRSRPSASASRRWTSWSPARSIPMKAASLSAPRFRRSRVRVTVHGPPGEVDERLATPARRLRARLGAYCYGEGNATMEGGGRRTLLADARRDDRRRRIVHRRPDRPSADRRARQLGSILGDVVAYSNASSSRCSACSARRSSTTAR